jgi:hypothetical protein
MVAAETTHGSVRMKGVPAMDLIAVTLILTFVVILDRSDRATVSAPAPHDQGEALVTLSWDPAQRRMLVAECDHGQWKNGACHKRCEALLQTAFRKWFRRESCHNRPPREVFMPHRSLAMTV